MLSEHTEIADMGDILQVVALLLAPRQISISRLRHIKNETLFFFIGVAVGQHAAKRNSDCPA